VHPDRHFGSQAATEHSRMLLEARAILKKALISEPAVTWSNRTGN